MTKVIKKLENFVIAKQKEEDHKHLLHAINWWETRFPELEQKIEVDRVSDNISKITITIDDYMFYFCFLGGRGHCISPRPRRTDSGYMEISTPEQLLRFLKGKSDG